MTKSHLFWGLGGLIVGVIAAQKIRSLPLISKLPIPTA